MNNIFTLNLDPLQVGNFGTLSLITTDQECQIIDYVYDHLGQTIKSSDVTKFLESIKVDYSILPKRIKDILDELDVTCN